MLSDTGSESFEVGERFIPEDKNEVLDEDEMPIFGDSVVNLLDLPPKDTQGD